MRTLVVLFAVLLLAQPVWCLEIAGVNIDQEITVDDGTVLKLNGAGIRKKMWLKIYISQLYLESPQDNTAAILADEGRRRVVMHFLYNKVAKEKLVAAWNEGFSSNLAGEERVALKEKIVAFNAMFKEDALQGDTIVLDYLPEKGTIVTIKGEARGVIEGKNFSDALLSIWLGKSPVNPGLKKAMLGK